VCGKADESMYNYVNTAYRQGLVINYNAHPFRRGYGSAIFFHVSTGGSTAGCISTDYNTVVKAIRLTRPGDVIVQGVASEMIASASAAPARTTRTLSIGNPVPV
jgi:L,D-peptidoglycan transpeptidase YkuD (ErfK/YbiS/YcfS/YnhG family)